MSHETSTLTIDFGALDHNVKLLQSLIGPECGLCPIVKSGAYGLGAVRIAKRLVHHGVRMLAVYSPGEACELLRAPVDAEILILMPVREVGRVDELYRGLVAGRVQLTVHDEGHMADLVALGEKFGMTIPVHLEVDTGLHRGGCDPQAAGRIIDRIAAGRRLRLAGLFTHFACAASSESRTDQQFKTFSALLEAHRPSIPGDCLIHAANTCATLRASRFHASMVRIGLAWAGFGTELLEGDSMLAEGQSLQPVITWSSRLVHIKRIAAGETVGYRAAWTARRDSVVGVVPVGYTDGYPAGLSATDQRPSRACVGVEIEANGGRMLGFATPIGLVNMDQMMIDLTDVVGVGRVGVGSMVQLIGPDRTAPNHMMTLAKQANVLPHELISRLHPRVKRVYQSPAAVAHVASGVDLIRSQQAAAG